MELSKSIKLYLWIEGQNLFSTSCDSCDKVQASREKVNASRDKEKYHARKLNVIRWKVSCSKPSISRYKCGFTSQNGSFTWQGVRRKFMASHTHATCSHCLSQVVIKLVTSC